MMQVCFGMMLAIVSAPPTVIVNARIEVGNGQVLERASVAFSGSKIIGVGDIKIPAGAHVIDAKDKVVTPGLIEVLTQIGLVEVGMEAVTSDRGYSNPPIMPAFSALDAFNPHSVHIPIHRAGGITSALVSPRGGLLFGSGGWVDLRGRLGTGDTPSKAAAMFASIAGAGKGSPFQARGAQWLALKEAFEDARNYLARRSLYHQGKSPPLSLSTLHLQALEPVLQRKIPLVLHVYRAADILRALAFAKEQKIRLILAEAPEAWLVAKELKEASVPVIMKPRDQVPWSFDSLAARDEGPALLHRAGVQVALSAYDWSNNLRRLRQEAGIAVSHGFPRHEALRAITQTPAVLFGAGDTFGTIKKGLRADIVLWSGDPLELRSRAEKVWIAGEAQSMNHRQKALARRYQKRNRNVSKPKAVHDAARGGKSP
jgi:imidazolonepropionase-like amidohydrolase